MEQTNITKEVREDGSVSAVTIEVPALTVVSAIPNFPVNEPASDPAEANVCDSCQ